RYHIGLRGVPPWEATTATASRSGQGRRWSRGVVRSRPVLRPRVVSRQTGRPRGKPECSRHLPPRRPPVARYRAALAREANAIARRAAGASSLTGGVEGMGEPPIRDRLPTLLRPPPPGSRCRAWP